MVDVRASLVLVAATLLACSSGSASTEAVDAGCPPTLATYCSESDCSQSWSAAATLACTSSCAGGVFLYACGGLNVADCPGEEGGGSTSYYDPATGTLVAVVRQASVVAGGLPGCFAGSESLRYLYDSGSTPPCPTGPLLGCDGRPVGMGSGPRMDGASADGSADGYE